MRNILSLQQLKVKENTKLMAKSSKSTNCKTSSHASWFVC
ncbi:class III lanthipeptide [Streptococcus pantholopis]